MTTKTKMMLIQLKNLTTKTTPLRIFCASSRSPPPSFYRALLFPEPASITPPRTFSNAAFASVPGAAHIEVNGAPTAAFVDDYFPLKLQPGVLVYDGACHLCHRGVKWIASLDEDRNIKFCCLQSRAAEPYLGICGLTREDVLHRFIFIEDPIHHHLGSTAALKVLSYMPLPYSALSSLLVLPEPFRDSVYDYLANKGCQWLGKEDDCIVLEEIELLDRFIDSEELWKRKKSKGL